MKKEALLILFFSMLFSSCQHFNAKTGLKTAQKNDLKEIQNFISQVKKKNIKKLQKEIAEWILSEKNRVILAWKDNKIIALIALRKISKDKTLAKSLPLLRYSKVSWIGVSPAHRHQSIASQLLLAAEKQVTKWKQEGIFLDCKPELVPFYEKNGYEIGKRKENLVYMKKEIKRKP